IFYLSPFPRVLHSFPTRRSSDLEITVPLTYRQDHVVYLGREQVRAAVLQERIRQKMETATKKEVFLGGDRGVNLGELMEVFSMRSEEHTSELQSQSNLVCRLLLE